MKRTIFTGLTALTLALAPLSSATASDKLHLLLSLQRSTNGAITDTISIWGTDIDPNSSSVDDRYELRLNGTPVEAPDHLLAALDAARRGYSYDSFTKGITQDTAKAICNMAGPAKGQMLLTRYLTYENAQISSSDMQVVLCEPLNCLYAPRVHPNDMAAHLAATRALGSLSTLLDMHRN